METAKPMLLNALQKMLPGQYIFHSIIKNSFCMWCMPQWKNEKFQKLNLAINGQMDKKRP